MKKKQAFVFYFLRLLLIDDSIPTQSTTSPNMKDCQNKDINMPPLKKIMVKTCLLIFFSRSTGIRGDMEFLLGEELSSIQLSELHRVYAKYYLWVLLGFCHIN